MAAELPLELRLEETEPSQITSLGRQLWHFRIELPMLGQSFGNRIINDPFAPDEYRTCAKYLVNRRVVLHDTQRISASLGYYRTRLFSSLGIQDFAQHLNNKKLEILICDRYTGGQSKSFQSLQWEQLEHPDAWVRYDSKIISVTVKRIVDVPLLQPVSSKHIFNILLVVARRHIFDQEYDIPSPATIQCTILEVQEKLGKSQCLHDIDLEVVRPGSFSEFQTHLRHRRAGPLAKRYDAVHFDLHGKVRHGIGYLEFNEYDDTGKLQSADIEATNVAVELANSNIRCAIVNACKSATTQTGVLANLSRVFLIHNVHHVLAMSYDILDSTAEKFFVQFYHNFILDGQEFSDAASHARRELLNDPMRLDYDRDEHVEIQDWFIPVVYSNGIRFYVSRSSRLDMRLRAWLRTPLGFGLSLKLQHVLAMLVYWLIALWSTPILDYSISLMEIDSELVADLIKFCYWLWLGPALWYWTRRNQLRGKRFLEAVQKHRYDRKNILRIEGNVKFRHDSKMVFFYSKGEIQHNARPLLTFVADIWRRTNFVSHKVVIKAEWFIQQWELDTNHMGYASLKKSIRTWTQSFTRLLQLSLLRVGTSYHCPGTESRTVIIIDNINALGPSRDGSQLLRAEAQDRLDDWLSRYFVYREGTAQPYLVVLGRAAEGISGRWFEDSFPKVRTLASVNMTEFVADSWMLKHREEWKSSDEIQIGND